MVNQSISWGSNVMFRNCQVRTGHNDAYWMYLKAVPPSRNLSLSVLDECSVQCSMMTPPHESSWIYLHPWIYTLHITYLCIHVDALKFQCLHVKQGPPTFLQFREQKKTLGSCKFPFLPWKVWQTIMINSCHFGGRILDTESRQANINCLTQDSNTDGKAFLWTILVWNKCYN